jgi:hypothetical protein
VLYRGPLNPFGVGIAVFTVLLSAHVLPPVILVAAVMAVVQVQNVCDPTNTANVWVANFTGVAIAEITKRTLPFQVAVATAATLVVVFAAQPLFGAQPFASLVSPAMAGVLPGLYAPASAANRIAVGGDGTALGSAAAAALAKALDRAPWHTIVKRDEANATDCATKPYAAYVQVTATTFRIIEGTDLDVGVRLQDCGGWIVDEWHDHAICAGTPANADARALALEGAARVSAWAQSDTTRAQNLFTHGLASAPGDAPTYFYTLFKTVDGNMRVFARAGGPAYVAGLRTGDIVEKLDGRFWWEYGTYQTQLRAYDGAAHSFEIERNGQTIDIQLGAPFET